MRRGIRGSPSDLYFVITASFTEQSKLYRLRFADPKNPAAGGKVDQLLDGPETGGTSERPTCSTTSPSTAAAT